MLVGESFSGPVAVSIAAAPPPDLRGLVLCCSFVRSPRPFLSALRWFVRFFPVRAVPAWFASAMLLGRFATPNHREALMASLAKVHAGVLRVRIRTLLSVDVSAKLAAIRLPVLLMSARGDRVIPRRCLDEMRLLLPSAECAEFAAPHFLLQTVPDDAARCIANFARKVSG